MCFSLLVSFFLSVRYFSSQSKIQITNKQTQREAIRDFPVWLFCLHKSIVFLWVVEDADPYEYRDHICAYDITFFGMSRAPSPTARDIVCADNIGIICRDRRPRRSKRIIKFVQIILIRTCRGGFHIRPFFTKQKRDAFFASLIIIIPSLLRFRFLLSRGEVRRPRSRVPPYPKQDCFRERRPRSMPF